MADSAKIESIESLTVSAAVLGELLGVSDRRVRQLAEEGIFTRVSKGRYSLPESIKTYINMLKMEKDVASSIDPSKFDLDLERAIHERVKRKQAEIKLAVMKGECHTTSDVKQVLTDMLVAFRAKLLNLPSKLAPTLVQKEDAGVIRDMINKEILEALGELKEYNAADYYGKGRILYDEEEIEQYDDED